MITYLKGALKNLFNPAVSVLALTDCKSEINRRARINRFVKIINTTIGRYSYVGSDSWIINAEIGAFCSIAWNVRIGLAGHTMKNISTSPIFTERNNGTGYSWTDRDLSEPTPKTVVGNDVWIGDGARIMPGLTIGDGAVIGTGAIVTHDVAPYAVVGGVPAKLIKYRFPEEVINMLLKTKWWELDDSILKDKISLFQTKQINKHLIYSIIHGGGNPPHILPQ